MIKIQCVRDRTIDFDRTLSNSDQNVILVG